MVAVQVKRIGARQEVERRLTGAGAVHEHVGELPSAVARGEGHAYEEDGAVRAGDRSACALYLVFCSLRCV